MTIAPELSILVVDDQQPMRKTLGFILHQAGLKSVLFAEDGESAWKCLESGPVDLVLLDWNMPRLSGLELLSRLRGDTRFAGLPVVMVTAEAGRDHVLAAVSAGVTNYVVKPFSPGTLLRKIETALEQARRAGWRAG